MNRWAKAWGQDYALVVAGVTFLCLLMAAGLRSAPGVLMVPWEKAFLWDRDVTSLAAAVGIFLYGLMGPFAAALMQSLGLRRTLIGALALMLAAIAASLFMTKPWHLIATWGVMSGLGSGCVAMVLAATVVNRWFTTHRGVVTGLLTASMATGTLIFVPGFAALSDYGWRPVVIVLAVGLAALIPLVAWLLPERPAAIGTLPYGAREAEAVSQPAAGAGALTLAFSTLGGAARTVDFWLLFATFFICGFTTNGLIGTHMIAMCSDYGMAAVSAGTLLAVMGVFDLIGTTASGWLTDRFDARKLLFLYYVLRGVSLIYLPYTDFDIYQLSLFAMFYGLDWIATVPPTLRLANGLFGMACGPIVFGWIAAGHQLGAACAAFMTGVLRASLGSYLEAFLIAGTAAVTAGFLALLIGRGERGAEPASGAPLSAGA